ncbi:MAG: ROK family protein [Pseudomonadota bacterium]
MNAPQGSDLSAVAPKGCGPFVPVSGTAESLRLSIFERIRAAGAVSRAGIAKELSISPASVTTQTSALIELGFVREEHLAQETGRGRPPIALTVAPEAHLVAGLKLSDRENTAVICDFAGRQLAATALETPATSSTAEIAEATATLVARVCAEAGVDQQALSAVCVGVPGFVVSRTGMVNWSPIMRARHVPLAQVLSTRLGKPVIIDNDANLVALAELWFGVGREISDFAVVTIEHGVGMGLVVDHRLYSGARGMGMELGHTKVALDGALCRCGQRGCLEAYVADYALVREAALAMPGALPGAPIEHVLEALHREAKAGNPTARSIFERAGKYLSMGMANVANLFDPQLIILSGDRMQYDYLYSEAILEDMKRHALDAGASLPPVEVHAWGDLLWASGAAAKALSYITELTLSETAVVER